MDVELWPRSWASYRQEFPDSFRRYILGETGRGAFGLPFQLRLASNHGLRFTFLVESLFSCEFGIEPLRDIVDLILDAGQDVQLHAHPEWITHSANPILEPKGRYVFSQFTLAEQHRLIDTALAQLGRAGGKSVTAFRAGSFAANADTLAAVSRARLTVDSSFKLGADLGRAPISEYHTNDPPGKVLQFPLSTYEHWPGRRRHLQLTACSLSEIVFVLENAWLGRWGAVVLLSHSAELLNRDRTRPDMIVVRRFQKLCQWLADRRETHVTSWFGEGNALPGSVPHWAPIRSTRWRTLLRVGEQALRRMNV